MLKSFQLLLRIGPIMTSPAPREVMDALTAVSVKESSSGRSGFSLTFTVSKNGRVMQDLLPNGYFEPIVTRVQIVVIAQGTPTTLMDGIVSKIDLAPSNEPAKTTLTITGEDIRDNWRDINDPAKAEIMTSFQEEMAVLTKLLSDRG